MRKLWLIAGVAFAIAGCGKDEAAEQVSNGGQQVSVDSIGGNDITAIDAATSSDANMAADVDYNFEDLNALDAEDIEAGNAAQED